MAAKDRFSATFTGGSGQMAVMGELLHRKCNAAIPHVDVGTDVFAFKDDAKKSLVSRSKPRSDRGIERGRVTTPGSVCPWSSWGETTSQNFSMLWQFDRTIGGVP